MMTESVPSRMATIEAISAGYAAKFGLQRDDTWFMLKLQEEIGELTQAFLASTGRTRPKGRTPDELRDDLSAELADVYCHTLLLAHHLGIDLEVAVRDKWLQWS